jgi:hypothetical protein
VRFIIAILIGLVGGIGAYTFIYARGYSDLAARRATLTSFASGRFFTVTGDGKFSVSKLGP